MSHTHHCPVCKVPVAVCSDEHCLGDEGHYCTLHHPDPAYHQDLIPPPGRNTTTVVIQAPTPTKE